MWNFLATKGDRLHWYEHGAVPLAVDTFFDSEHQTSPIGFLNANHPLLELSIGVLVQFAEMESVKVQLCNNNRFMRRFCEVIADTRNLSSSNDEILYNGQVRDHLIYFFGYFVVEQQVFLNHAPACKPPMIS